MAAVLPDSAQHADAHLVGATEQLQAFLVMGADLPVQVTGLVHQLVSLEGGGLVMRLDVGFAVVGQAHQARLDRFTAPAHAEITVGLAVHVGDRREPGQLAVHVGQVASQHGPRREGGVALRAAVHPQVVQLVPVDLDAFQAEGIATRNGDRIPQSISTQGAVKLRG